MFLELLAENHAVGVLVFNPALDVGFPAHFLSSKVDHAASADRRGTRLSKVLYLEEHVHLLSKLDALAVRKAKSLVIVEDSVHILDPEGIDRAIKDSPDSVKLLSFRRLLCCCAH
jgi:hypothetical protein